MNIGYGSISIYDSIRYDLFLDKPTNTAFFVAFGKKYNIKLNDMYINLVTQNKKLWITLTQLPYHNNQTIKIEPTIKIIDMHMC